jgi:hypothetical protein
MVFNPEQPLGCAYLTQISTQIGKTKSTMTAMQARDMMLGLGPQKR